MDGTVHKTGRTAFEAAIGWSGDFNAANGLLGPKRVSAYDITRYVKMVPPEVRTTGGPGGGGGGTSRSVSYDISNPQTAKAIINQALSNQIGRKATDDEVAAFTKALNAQEKANPTIMKTTFDGSGSSESTQSGGFDMNSKQQFAVDEAQDDPAYSPYQKATTYFDAFVKAIQSPVAL